MNAGDATALHELIAAEALRRASDPETELFVTWRRHRDRRRHERAARPGVQAGRARSHG